MAKKIVVLNGSPHKKGPTSALVTAFTEGAQTGGAEVTEFLMEDMDIHTCLGCFKGNSQNEYPCVLKDAMAQIYASVKECDVLVLAGPVYYWNLSGQLKTTIDRLVALEEGTNILTGGHRSVALIMTSAGEDDQFELPVAWFEKYHTKMKWHNLGTVLAPGLGDSSSQPDSTYLEQANGLGQRAATGII